MSEKKWFAFYTYAYGLTPKCEEFDTYEELVEFAKKACAKESPYWSLRVVYGEEYVLEPATYVESYRAVPAPSRSLPND